ncbi:low-specificity L-threonine aldolase [Desnuesiella massiliensis]|uniref:low-specificity L-threonine aldolase n=1 Tax=Desnuesiella massiliensis TaxID=1650662 RepID=UPI0006E459AA|nr:low-specificity L-threonine aldolase [Desnuesiella massiliensis]
MDYIDLRSDTVTHPTAEMREAMFKAVVGDDVYGDDPTVLELEALAAEICGKEAALLVPSGTFGNQLALFTHCPRGSEVILGDDCHIVVHEVGAASVIAGVQLRTLASQKGLLSASDIEKRIRIGEDIHYPATSLICLENAHSSGRVIPIEKMSEIRTVANKHNIPIHLDGARLFNAATALNVDVKEIAKYCDSIMFCLSKGLCAPIGSMLVGNKAFIEKARKNRKLMGGGLRQAGFIAAAGIIALKHMTTRLQEDHTNAKILAEELSKLTSVEVNKEDVQINMVFFKILKDIDSEHLVNYFHKNGVKINPPENGDMRFVTNYWIKENHIHHAINLLRDYLN